MKRFLFALTAGAVLAFTGCSKTDGGLDTAKVEAAFAAAQQTDKAELQAALNSLKAGDYPAALASLQKAAANVKLTPEQKTALADLVVQVKARAGDLVKQATETASQAGTNATSQVDALAKKAGEEASKVATNVATNVKNAADDLVKKASAEAVKAATGLQKTLVKP
jgi:hypothetical protein